MKVPVDDELTAVTEDKDWHHNPVLLWPSFKANGNPTLEEDLYSFGGADVVTAN